jgi:arsenate reductase
MYTAALAALGIAAVPDRERCRITKPLLTPLAGQAHDLAVTLGCGEECPYVPGVTYRDWPVADPGGQDEATVRRIVTDLDSRVRDLLVELVPDIEFPPSVLDPR